MRIQSKWCMALVAVAILAQGGAVQAADPVPTNITIEGMVCAGCAKKIASKLYAVPGVATVQANVEAKTTTVSPRAQQVLSPRALWEAVEKAGYRPTKLEGPSGTFTAKPQS